MLPKKPRPTLDDLAPGTKLTHYKGGQYIIVGVCTIEANLTQGILYQNVHKPSVVWMRPSQEFLDWVDSAEGLVPRFTKSSEASP